MSCLSECKEIKVYDYNTNKTLEFEDCICTGCCNTLQMLLYFMYLTFFFIISLLLCEIPSYKKKYQYERRTLIMNNNEQLPEYTENV